MVREKDYRSANRKASALTRRTLLHLLGSAGLSGVLAACGGGSAASGGGGITPPPPAAPPPPPPPPPVPSITPGPRWTGAPGSGGSPPVDPVRSSAKPFLRALFVPDDVFAQDVTILFDAHAKGGIQKVTIWCEGTTADVTAPRWIDYADANGTARRMYGYAFKLSWADFNAVTATGTAHIYATATASDGSIQTRTIGPLAMHNRADMFAGTRTVGSGGDHATVQGALDWITANAAATRNYRVLIKSSGSYDLSASVATIYNGATHWVTIQADTGVTAIMTSGASRVAARLRYDGLRFRGSGIVIDTGKLSAIVMEAAGLGKLWIDSCTISQTGGRHSVYDGMPPTTYWMQMASGAGSRFYATDSSADDVYDGFSACQLVRNCSANHVAADAFQNNRCVHGISSDGVSPSGPGGLRTHLPAVNISYSGPGVPLIAISGAPNIAGAASRILQLYVDGAAAGPPFAITNPNFAPSGSGYTSWAQVAAHIGSVAGFSATVNGAAGVRRAISASKDGLTPTVDLAVGSGREIAFSGGAATITSIFDVHADFMQYFGTYENVGGRFMTYKNADPASGGQGFFVDDTATTITDCWWRNFQGAGDGTAIAPRSQIASSWSHSGLENFTLYDMPFPLRTDASGAGAFNPDARSQIRNCAFYSLAWGGAPDPDLTIDRINVRSGTLPAGATNGSTTASGLFTAPPGNLAPVSGGPLLVGGSYLGALLPGGDWNV